MLPMKLPLMLLNKKILFINTQDCRKILNKASISDINSIKDVVEIDTESKYCYGIFNKL